MPDGLKRFQQSAQSHFVTFTCYHRRRGFDTPAVYDLFVQVVEQMRRRFALCVYGYVVMPEHVHLLLSEPQRGLLADALHYLKLSFAKRQVPQVRVGSLDANLGMWDRNVGTGVTPLLRLTMRHRRCVGRAQKKSTAEANYLLFQFLEPTDEKTAIRFLPIVARHKQGERLLIRSTGLRNPS
jgi:REP element-mobilizing transposase RayT